VKSKRSKAEERDEGAKRHSRTAFNAMFAKNGLLAGESSAAEETEPSGLTSTRTLMRTVPRIVLRAFEETSGITWCSTATVPEAGPEPEGPRPADGFAAGAGAAEVSLPCADRETGGFALPGVESAAAVFAGAAGSRGVALGGALAG
jgi:hypothetical protein